MKKEYIMGAVFKCTPGVKMPKFAYSLIQFNNTELELYVWKKAGLDMVYYDIY